MTYTEVSFSRKLGFKKIGLIKKLVFILKLGFTKIVLTPKFPLPGQKVLMAEESEIFFVAIYL